MRQKRKLNLPECHTEGSSASLCFSPLSEPSYYFLYIECSIFSVVYGNGNFNLSSFLRGVFAVYRIQGWWFFFLSSIWNMQFYFSRFFFLFLVRNYSLLLFPWMQCIFFFSSWLLLRSSHFLFSIWVWSMRGRRLLKVCRTSRIYSLITLINF